MIARPHVVLAYLLCAASSARAEHPDDELWKLVAKSHFIVVGIPAVTADQIETARQKRDYVHIPVQVTKWLKGDSHDDKITIRYYPSPQLGPSPAAVSSVNDKEAVLFVVKQDEEGVQGLYFAEYQDDAIQKSSSELISRVAAEVSSQNAILREFGRIFHAENEQSCTKVRSLIEAMLSRRTEEKAFADLEAMGKDAVPCMIMFMDDRRKLPIQHIALRNEGGFEAFRQYGPKVVVDAVAAILNQVTGESFDFIENGASERQRKEAIKAWRIYLYRTRFGMKPLT